jgi:glyoxylase-like metal-dependent hydrolase (beta-lactamase superfamily II)
MLEKTIVVGPFQCNCRIWVCPRTGESVVVDPGDEGTRILQELSMLRIPSGVPVRVKYLLHTHGHLDHIAAAASLRTQLTPASFSTASPKIALHRADEPLYLNLKSQSQLFGLHYEDPLPVDHYLEDGEEIKVGDLRFSVLHTPGHSPGSVCLRLHQDTAHAIPEAVLSGDTLFQSSVGRTDLWGANQEVMFKSIFERLLILDGDTRVCPGHGPDTRIGVEKLENPFLR